MEEHPDHRDGQRGNSMSQAIAAPSVVPDSVWKSPASGLWVAGRDGEYLGMVERVEGKYVATNAMGELVGVFDDLSYAHDCVESEAASIELAARDRRTLNTSAALLAFSVVGMLGGVLLLLVR
jgi:hypothetical protein